MNEVELKALNELLATECGWRVEIGVSPVDEEEFFRVYEIHRGQHQPDGDESTMGRPFDNFVGVMPICTTLGAFVSSGALCQYYYQKGRRAGTGTEIGL